MTDFGYTFILYSLTTGIFCAELLLLLLFAGLASMEGGLPSVFFIGMFILLIERAPVVYYPAIFKALLLLPNIIIFEGFLFSNTCLTIYSFCALVSSEDYGPAPTIAADDMILCFFY